MDPSTSDAVDWQLRLEIPVKKSPDFNYPKSERVVAQINELLKQLENAYEAVNWLRDPAVVEGEFLDTVEYTINVTPHNFRNKPTSINNSENIFLLLKAIGVFSQNNELRNFFIDRQTDIGRGTIIISSNQWFINEIASCETEVPLTQLAFGTFFRNSFYSHYVIGGENQGPDGNNQDIVVDYLFDQNQVIVIFDHEEHLSNKQANRKECCHVRYRVQVLMQNIRRVVLDIREHGPHAMFLDLDNPPIVKKCSVVSAVSKDELENRPHKRWVKIQRGPYNSSKGSSEAVLVENTTLRLEFKQNLHYNDAFKKRFWHIVSRLRHRCSVPIEFQPFEVKILMYSFYEDPYSEWVSLEHKKKTDSPATYPDDITFRETFLNQYFPTTLDVQNKLMIHYLLEALISRGAVVKDHLLLSLNDWKSFLRIIGSSYEQNPAVCIEALKRLMTAIDEQKRLFNLGDAYRIVFNKLIRSGEECGLSEDKIREGYMLVPRIVITPTRNIRIQPEMCMGNRVLRNQMKNDPSIIIRVSFRDDDNTLMRTTKTSDFLLERAINNAFNEGLYIAGRRYYYLGSSSSQMRDCGAYFMIGCTEADKEQFEKQFPDATPDDPRMSIRILRHNLGSEPYIFTDGVGSISPGFAKKMAEDMRLSSVPSCFQYRFRGHKGVQVVDYQLEEIAKWAKNNKIPTPPDHKDIKGNWEVSSIFRPSQIKFSSKRFERQPIEVVKFSGPTSVCLNKPLINIYDQVTAKQSYECHQRVTNRIENLLNLQIQNIVKMLLEERHCRNKLKELPKRINIDELKFDAGFELCCEPFFASLVRASVRFTILKQLRKEQIQVPPNLGRSMLGVNDISNRLQYGQVFVQYTNDIRDYSPHINAAKTIITGKVMVTKNPTSVGGDLRVFEAVDIPELHHLVDVIVFPVHGPRPMPDEMAGSDLDGDEYSVVWDPQLLIDHNVEPAIYESDAKSITEIDKDKMDEEVRNAFIDYVKKDNIGVISNALLFQSDLYGLDSQVVKDLAVKANMALEFLKSGVAPERLRDKWENKGTTENPEWLPPEKPERYPDFHFGNDYCPIYYSPRLTGRLYREIKLIEDVLKMVEETDAGKELELDPFLEYSNWKSYEKRATDDMEAYNGKLKTVMETYGIKSEAELISGCIVEMRSRITDKDQDDFSYFNQRTTINDRVTEIMREAREKFFDEFGGWKVCTQVDDYRDVENVFRRKCCRMQQIEIKQKASAYYMVCYKKNKIHRAGQTRLLSFAWLPFDILGNIREVCAYNSESHTVFDKPILRILDKHIATMNDKYQNKRKEFSLRRISQNNKCSQVLYNYCTKYEGLADVLFVLEQWAHFNKHLTDRFTDTHLLFLLILFATGRLGSTSGEPVAFLDWIELKADYEEIFADRCRLFNKGEILLKFFEFLSSRKFKTLKYLSFYELGLNSTFMRGEWLVIHQAAFKTYLNIAFSMDFDDLGLNSVTKLKPKILRELDPFVIELPHKTDLKDVENRLKRATGVEEVKLRYITTRGRRDRAVVVCRGTLENCYKLKQLVAVRPSIHTKYTPKELSDTLPAITLQNILAASESVIDTTDNLM